MMAISTENAGSATQSRSVSRLWQRELQQFPTARTKSACLVIIVGVTVLFYYQYYLLGAVGDKVIASTGMSFVFFVNVNVVSLLVSALMSFFGGLTDRYGRANVVVAGILGCALTCIVGFPLADGKISVAVLYTLLGAFEGLVLVATPALVRDFSPQVGRATAMGFWTVGPVAGSLLTSVAVSATIDHVGRWQDEYAIAGGVGLGVFVIAAWWLRELSGPLRDQLIVNDNDHARAETRARGLDTDALQRHPLRQMVRPDIVGSAAAISLFLIFYFAAVGFLPIFFETVFGYSTSKANSLGNWLWGAQAATLILFGWMSDRLRVRKPFMLLGAVGAAVSTAVMLHFITEASTSYTTWVVILVAIAVFSGMTFAPWMASFTETVERRNPALTGTGLGLWGGIVRAAATIVTFILPLVVGSVTLIIQDGPAIQALVAGKDPALSTSQNRVVKAVVADPSIATKTQALATRYSSATGTAALLTPAVQQALADHPDDARVQLSAVAQIAHLDVGTVAKVASLGDKYAAELATAQAIDSTTQITLLNKPSDPGALTKATREVAAALHVSPQAAANRLAALAKVPSTALIFMAANADSVQRASTKLQELGRVPAADLAYLARYGPSLQSPLVQSKLRYLQATGPKVENAIKHTGAQWRNYFSLGLAGQLIFIPLMFLMAGYWNPRRARRALQRHEALVQAEVAAITNDR